MRKPIGRPPASVQAVRVDFAVQEFIDVALRKAAPGTVAVKRTTLTVMMEMLGRDFPVWAITDIEMGMIAEKAINGETVEEAARYGRFGRHVRTGRNTTQGMDQVKTTLTQFIDFCTRNRKWMPVGVFVPGEVFTPAREDLTDQDGEFDVPTFPYAEWPYVLSVAEKVHPRARIAIALGFYLGRRASEYVHMQWKRIDWERQCIRVYNVKRRRWVWMPLYPEVLKELLWWRTWITERFGEIDPEWYIVPAKLQSADMKGAGSQVGCRHRPELWPVDPAKQSRVSSMVREARRVLAHFGYNSNEKSGTHTWRRSAAIHFSEEYGILAAQALLDHKDVTTTQRYTKNSDGTRRLWAAVLPGATPPGGFGLENVAEREQVVEYHDNVVPLRREAS